MTVPSVTTSFNANLQPYNKILPWICETVPLKYMNHQNNCEKRPYCIEQFPV